MERDQHPATILTEQAYDMSPKNFSINGHEEFYFSGEKQTIKTALFASFYPLRKTAIQQKIRHKK